MSDPTPHPTITPPPLLRDDAFRWSGTAREEREALPQGEALLPGLVGYQEASLRFGSVLGSIVLMVFLIGLFTGFCAALLGLLVSLLGGAGLMTFDEAAQDLGASLAFGITVGLVPLGAALYLMTDQRPIAGTLGMSTAHPEPTPRIQADLLAQVLGHLGELKGLSTAVEAPLREDNLLGWRIYLCRHSASVGWVLLNEDRGLSRLELGLLTTATAASLQARLAAHPQAREALEAAGLRPSGLGLQDGRLPDGAAVVFSPDLGLPLPAAARLDALQTPPDNLPDDPALTAALLLALLVEAALDAAQPAVPDEDTAALCLIPPTLRAASDALTLRDASWEVKDRPALHPPPLQLAPLQLAQRGVTLGVLGVALSACLLAAGLVTYTWGRAPLYFTFSAPMILLVSTLSALALDGNRPRWGHAAASTLRAAPLRGSTLDLSAEGVLSFDPQRVDLQRPFTLELTRATAPPGDATTALHLTLTQRAPAGGVQRLTLSASGLRLDDAAKNLPVLDVPSAPRLDAEAAQELWPLLRDAAASHGQPPRFDLALIDLTATASDAPAVGEAAATAPWRSR